MQLCVTEKIWALQPLLSLLPTLHRPLLYKALPFIVLLILLGIRRTDTKFSSGVNHALSGFSVVLPAPCIYLLLFPLTRERAWDEHLGGLHSIFICSCPCQITKVPTTSHCLTRQVQNEWTREITKSWVSVPSCLLDVNNGFWWCCGTRSRPFE